MELLRAIKSNITIGWTIRKNIQAKMRVAVKRIFKKHKYPSEETQKAVEIVLEQAKVVCEEWARKCCIKRVDVHLSEMNILSWNVNGLTSREKNGQLKWFYDEKPDILCLQETKLTSKNTEEFSEDFSGYYKYNAFERNGSGTSGVSIFTQKKPLNVERSFNGKYEGYGRILKADYENFILLNVYFPHEGAPDCDHYDFYDSFLEYAADLTQYKDVLICGDFNIAHKEEDLENPEKDEMGFKEEQRDKLDKLINNGYLDTFRMFNEEPENYTWWGNGFRTRERCRGWRIDYFFASESLKHRIELGYIRSDIIGSKDLPGSDHCPIGVKMKI